MKEELHELAALIVECLDAQREYFRNRDTGQLATCKRIEGELRRRANLILNPPANPEPSLFG